MPPTPPLDWQALHLARAGHRAEEYEDAHAGDAGAGRFAVADGASETSFAALWARLLAEGFVQAEGDWLPGDTFFLMTDALACWFLREGEEGRQPWDELSGFSGATALEDFARRIEALRDGEGLKNDDVTLIQVTLRGEAR